MAQVKTVTAQYGTTIPVNVNGETSFHKLFFSIEVALDEGDDVGKIKEMCWNTCINEVQNQVDELLASF